MPNNIYIPKLYKDKKIKIIYNIYNDILENNILKNIEFDFFNNESLNNIQNLFILLNNFNYKIYDRDLYEFINTNYYYKTLLKNFDNIFIDDVEYLFNNIIIYPNNDGICNIIYNKINNNITDYIISICFKLYNIMLTNIRRFANFYIIIYNLYKNIDNDIIIDVRRFADLYFKKYT